MPVSDSIVISSVVSFYTITLDESGLTDLQKYAIIAGGGACGALLVLILMVLCCFCCCCNGKR